MHAHTHTQTERGADPQQTHRQGARLGINQQASAWLRQATASVIALHCFPFTIVVSPLNVLYHVSIVTTLHVTH